MPFLNTLRLSKTDPRLAENFDEQFKNLKVELTPRTADVEMIIRDLRGDEFNGFSWTNSEFFNPDRIASNLASTKM